MPCRSAVAPLTQRHHELQGPRPSPLNVKGDSRGIVKKRRPVQARQPVIIYVESPKVIHAHPSEFRSVVQRLTGAPSSGAPSPLTVFSAAAPPQFPFHLFDEALNDSYCRTTLPLVASNLSPMAAPAPPAPASLFSSFLPGDAGRGFSFFSNDQLGSPAFLFDQNVVPIAGPGSVPQANLVPSPGGACHGDIFINQWHI